LLKPGDLLLTTWRGDGHCDHEAAGRACAQAAQARRVPGSRRPGLGLALGKPRRSRPALAPSSPPATVR
jgi:LmbE family N-acetylglucosaminyl deacetylase